MTTNKIVLGIIGEISSGKTTATDYLKEKYGAKSVRFSDSLGSGLDRFYIEKNRHNYQTLSRIMRENFGQDIISKTVARDIENFDAEIVITEGIRRPSDIIFLTETYPNNFFTINIETNEENRFKRLADRGEKPDDITKTWEEFQKDGQAEAELAIQEIAKDAQFTIKNDGTLEKLHSQIEDILKKIKI